jgi:hypothetical protein
MLTAAWLLLLIGALGAFDIFTFHRAAALTRRPDTRREAWLHVARGVVYSVQFVLVATLELHGAWYAAFVALVGLDVAIALADVACEPEARRAQGGLPPGEYLAHIVLSVLVGAYLHALVGASAAWWSQPTAIVVTSAHAPLVLRGALLVMAAGSLGATCLDALELCEPVLRRPRPVQVAVVLRTSLERLWTLTQDHHLHPSWDHRFSRITMLGGEGADDIRTGTLMAYERDLAGVLTIRGFGRYKLHRPLRQSTFEFWSEDPRSLLRRGVGLWLYRPQADGTIRFSTSYTYEVRWGVLGRLIDRLVLRPFLQRETERSFARLAREHFAS